MQAAFPAGLSAQKRQTAETVLRRLSSVPEMVAVVLGGSHATGRQTEASDLDFGLYYRKEHPFLIETISSIARSLSTDGEPVVTGFYEWGPWVNGGAWIHTATGKVDFLYRNLDQVTQTIDQSIEGRVQYDYRQQPPHGFYSVIYLAETHVCLPLYDPGDDLGRLKSRIAVYPRNLKAAIIGDSLWSAEFTFYGARSSAAAGDLYTTAGCLTRIAADLTQALFALNERYFLTDKRMESILASFRRVPAGYAESVSRVLSNIGGTAALQGKSVEAMHRIWKDVVSLTEGMYQPRYTM